MDDVSGTGTTEEPGPSADRGRPRVVVGVDGSPGARTALVLALDEAARRGADLDVVAAYPVTLVWTGGTPLDVPDVDAVRADTERRAQELLDEVVRDEFPAGVPGPAVDARVLAAEGRPVPVLLSAAEGADLLVLGSRGRGGMRSALLGSVALHCLSHAPCPVLIAHGGAPGGRTARVVVGSDGSAGSRAAVVAAIDEAVRSGADLEVVACYRAADYWTDLGTVVVPPVEDIRDDVRHHTEELVTAILAARSESDGVPPVRTRVVDGAAGDELVELARGASLLVVGSHGHGAMRGLLLGSVALHCALHAVAPVLVVRPRPTRTRVVEPRSERVLADR
jgi:nucleotide-binding universal stress UspA family protein